MTADESHKISTLTTGAIKSTSGQAIRAMLEAVEAAEEKTREMRAVAEEEIARFESVTDELAENVASHVATCQAAIDSFREHRMNITNIEQSSTAVEELRTRVLPVVRQATSDDHIGQLRAVADAIGQRSS